MLHGMLDALPDADQQPQSTGEKPGLLMQQLKTLKKILTIRRRHEQQYYTPILISITFFITKLHC